MWLFTNVGFFSVVQKSEQTGLTVRARVKEDLDRLRDKYMAHLSATTKGGGTDYPFRATITHAEFAAGLSKLILDIHYSSFKTEIAKVQGRERAKVYGEVWGTLHAIEDEVELKKKTAPQAAASKRSGKSMAYGGVVFNSQGEVLLREPKNHYGGYVWTFPKGHPQKGESIQQTALREVWEETGVTATIERELPGVYEGDTTNNTFFIMSVVDQEGEPGNETKEIAWVGRAEAAGMIALTTSPNGRERDLKILAEAYASYAAARSAPVARRKRRS